VKFLTSTPASASAAQRDRERGQTEQSGARTTSCTNTKVVTSGRGSAILRHVVGVRQHATLSRNNGRLHLHQLPDFAQLHRAPLFVVCSARQRGRRDGLEDSGEGGLSARVRRVREHFAEAAGLHDYPAATAVSAGSACLARMGHPSSAVLRSGSSSPAAIGSSSPSLCGSNMAERTNTGVLTQWTSRRIPTSRSSRSRNITAVQVALPGHLPPLSVRDELIGSLSPRVGRPAATSPARESSPARSRTSTPGSHPSPGSRLRAESPGRPATSATTVRRN